MEHEKYSLTGLPDHVWSLRQVSLFLRLYLYLMCICTEYAINDFEINVFIPRKLVRLGK